MPKPFTFIRQFYDMDLGAGQLPLKKRYAPTPAAIPCILPDAHGPLAEVMMTYEESENILFSADAFGCFGALNGNIFIDELDYTYGLAGGSQTVLRQHCREIRAAGTGCAGRNCLALEIAVVCPPALVPFGAATLTCCLIYTPSLEQLRARGSIRSPCSTAPCTAIRKKTPINILAAGLADAGIRKICGL